MSSEVLYFIGYLINEAFTLYCIFMFYHYFAKVKEYSWLHYGVVFTTAVLMYSLPNLIFKNILVNLMFAIMAFSLLIILFETNIKYKIVLVIFAYLMSMIAEIIIAVFSGVLGNPEYYSDIGYIVLSRLILFVMIKFIGIIFRGDRSYQYVSFYWWIVLIIPGSSMYIVHQTAIWGAQELGEPKDLAALSIALMLLIINLLVFYLYDKLLQKSNEALVIESIRLQNKSLTEYMEREAVNYNKLKKWKHDNKNYLIGLKALLDNQNLEEVNNMLVNEIGNIVEIDSINYSNNRILNSIFGYKLNEAQSKGITVQFDFDIRQTLNMDYNDLAILLGNSMDNAVEACSGLSTNEDKWISILMRYERNMLFYRIENKYVEVKKQKGVYITTKKVEAKDHGMGLRIIHSICKKYQGVMNISDENNLFKLEIMVFLN